MRTSARIASWTSFLLLLSLPGATLAQQGAPAPAVPTGDLLPADPPGILAPALALTVDNVTVSGEARVVEVRYHGDADIDLVAIHTGRPVARERCVGHAACALQVDADFLRAWLRAEDVDVLLWPRSLPLDPGEPLPPLVDPLGASFDPNAWSVGTPTVHFHDPLLATTELNVAASRTHVPLAVPEAVSSVRCRRARCVRRGDGIDVYGVDPGALSVAMTMELAPRCRREIAGRSVGTESVELPVVRCAMRALAPVPLLAGLDNHRYLLAVGRECLPDNLEELEVETRPPTRAWIRGELPVSDRAWRVVELLFESVPVGLRSLEIRLVQGGLQRTRLGMVAVPVESEFRPTALRFEAEELGPVDFIPINRDVRADIAFEESRWARDIRVVSRRGFYRARYEDRDVRLRADHGASGQVTLRMAYQPAALAEALGRTVTLATFPSAASYALRSMNLPLPLGEDAGFVRVVCLRHGEDLPVSAGRRVSIPYEERDSCRLLLDRTAIPEEAGVQRLRIVAGGKEQILAVAPGKGTMAIALPVGDKREFEKLVLTVGHEYGGGHYDLSPQHNIGPEARYRIVLGDRRVRISVGSAVPTGLFRFGLEGERGSLSLSAGATARLSFLYNEGTEFPIGLELGVLGTGLSDTPHLSFVAGIGLSIPVLNADTPLQTSFNIHAWAEYAPTRDGDGQGPWAFLFGPSFSVGKFSTTL